MPPRRSRAPRRAPRSAEWTIWWPFPSTSSIVTTTRVSRLAGGVPACESSMRERHREAAPVRRGKQLLGARLVLRGADARREREGQVGERRRGCRAERAAAPGDVAVPRARLPRERFWASAPPSFAIVVCGRDDPGGLALRHDLDAGLGPQLVLALGLLDADDLLSARIETSIWSSPAGASSAAAARGPARAAPSGRGCPGACRRSGSARRRARRSRAAAGSC